MRIFLFTFIAGFISLGLAEQAVAKSANKTLKAYPAPANADLNHDFDVRVSQNNSAWSESPCYTVLVANVKKDHKHYIEKSSVSSFDFSNEVEVAVTYNRGTIDSVRIRPLSYGIQYRVDKNTVYFKLNRPSNLSIEVNGDIFHNLQLFANPMEENMPSKKDKNVMYFGPGIHTCTGNGFIIPSGKTVYVAGGAVLKNRLIVDGVHDVKIMGRGIIDHSVHIGVKISHCKNISVEGIVLTQIPVGNSDNVSIKNVKSISDYGWGDGMNVLSSNHVFYDRVFCRNSDDCTTVYATRGEYKGGSQNVLMQNSTLWADVAHPIFVGLHGNAENPDTIQNITYRNIDILDECEHQVDYQGCLAVCAGDNNLVRNVVFDSIRIENIREGQLVNIRTTYNKKYCKAPGRRIENLLFRDVSYNGKLPNLSIICGHNDDCPVKDIRFERLNINGKVIYDDMAGKPGFFKTSDMAGFYVGENVENIMFTK
jgi:hypothetical protein